MDPLGKDIRAELARHGPQAGMAELVERWPAYGGRVDRTERVARTDRA